MTITEILKTEKMLLQRVYDHGRHVGYIVCRLNGSNQVNISWSVCSKHDRFSRDLGMKIAYERSYGGTGKEIPYCVRKMIPVMQERAAKYYKVA